jgi:starch phosphorylase
LADQVIVWRRKLENGWPALHLGHTSVETRDDRYHFTVEVELGALPPDPVRVELFADASDEQRPVCLDMSCPDTRSGDSAMSLYRQSVPAIRSAGDYTARIVPSYPGVNVPLETPYILWQR